MRLTHRQLEIFQSLMQTLNITATAQQLFSSQPTISRELKNIEEILGFHLFYRENRRLEPSQQAIALNVIVQRSFVSLDEIIRTAQAIREDRLKRLSIACLPAFAHALIPQALQLFLAQLPGTSIKIHSLEESALTRDLVSKFFDLGVVEGNFDRTASSTIDLYAGDLVCLMPASHPLAKCSVLYPQDLAGQDFIYYSEEDSYRREVDAFFSRANVSRRLLVETTTAPSIGSLVRSGIGLSIVNPLTALAFHGDGVCVRPLAQKIAYYVHVWQPEPAKRGPFASIFIQSLEKTIFDSRQRLDELFR
ncbi:LysR family transcriptional regulator [Falsochrobactrum sp. TDYN1]|uniref:LysR family transcriptional regulator n=1 Tax=Falsochrobactrum tianjinense TaxID=2706015 RepID=A0A949PK04_9HYPH|nr:LysR substrate-binding domain-containing protein [Falsochrobactrum sp. TDYN1]MBV2142372.1 LysR family transcriptional regulator [Falsochrobactrum sp. TDYN1]